jgi:hypothetical protein
MIYSEARKIVGEKVPDFSRTILVEGSKEFGNKRTYNLITY